MDAVMKLRDRFKAWLSRHERLERFWHALWRQRRKIRITIFLVAHLLGALTTVKAIMETRTAQGAVAWAVSLNAIPYLAVVCGSGPDRQSWRCCVHCRGDEDDEPDRGRQGRHNRRHPR